MSEIRLERVSKLYDGGVRAVDEVELAIGSGEFMVLVGPSGCGKTTLLRMIAGLETVSGGRIWIGGHDVTAADPGARDIAMVFQNYALYPHLTVEKNLGYALRVRKTPKPELERRVQAVATMLGLNELMGRKPTELSGGQRQRVAMGRAIVREPVAFLMDEPLSNLDAKLRVGMRAELVQLHQRLGITTVYVTHDQVEAMTLGQRVAVMRSGKLQQVDTPQRVYRDPANLFVAAFIGSPAMNLVEATIADDAVAFAGYRIPLDPRTAPAGAGSVILGIRPHHFDDPAVDPSLPTIELTPTVVEELGSVTHVIFAIDAPPVEVDAVRAATDEHETPMLLADSRRAVFTAEVSERATPRIGEPLRLSIDPRRFYFFDPESGERLRGIEARAAAVGSAAAP